MLTADLLRVTCRAGVIHPRYLNTRDDALRRVAESLTQVFDAAADGEAAPPRSDVEARLADIVSHKADPVLFRGLCKLLFDRCVFEQTPDHDPAALRKTLFQAAASASIRRQLGRSWEDQRRAVLGDVAHSLDLAPVELEALLFADLPANQRLRRYRPLSPEALLDRYNLALAQGVLLRAVRLTAALAPADVGAYRQLFRELKFRQLIHTVTALDNGAYRLVIDGPLSLFASVNRYGVAMAQFLPSLVTLEHWTLEAELRWGRSREPAVFRLDHKRGLQSHRRARGQYVTNEQTWFEQRFESAPGTWEMTRAAEILRTAHGDVVVPDIRFCCANTARFAYLEIIGYWRAGSLATRLEQLEDPGLDGLVLAVSSRLAAEREATPPEHPRIVWFKQVLPAKAVRERLETVAIDARRIGPG